MTEDHPSPPPVPLCHVCQPPRPRAECEAEYPARDGDGAALIEAAVRRRT